MYQAFIDFESFSGSNSLGPESLPQEDSNILKMEVG